MMALFAAALLFSAAPPVAAPDPLLEIREKFLAARLAEADGKLQEALEGYRAALALDPDDPILHFELAQLDASLGLSDDARTQAQSAVRVDPGLTPAWKLLGAIELSDGEKDARHFSAAVEALSRAHKQAPDDVAVIHELARAELSAGRADLARLTLDDLAGVDQMPSFYKLNAEVDSKRGATKRAREAYARWIDGSGGDREAVADAIDFYESIREFRRAVDLLQKLEINDADNAALEDRLAFDLLRAGRFADSEKKARAILALRPEDRPAQRCLASALEELGRSAESRAILQKLKDADPDEPSAVVALAYQISLAGDDEAAVKMLEDFASRLSGGSERDELRRQVESEVAAIRFRQRHFDDARRIAEATAVAKGSVVDQSLNILLELARTENHPSVGLDWARKAAAEEPQNAEWAADVAEFQIRSGQVAAGSDSLRALAESGLADNVVAAADAQVRLKNYSAAIEIARAGMARFEGNPELAFRQASALERAGKFDEAVAAFEAILRDRADDAMVLNYLGYMYADRGTRLDYAREMIGRALALDPNNGAYLDSLGWVYFRLGDNVNARRYLDEAAKRVPADSAIEEHLGDLEARAGSKEQALAHWKRSLELSPDDPAEVERKIRGASAAHP